MIFKNTKESASLLSQKIAEELSLNSNNSLLCYINPDSKDFCQLVADSLKLNISFLPNTITGIDPKNTLYLLIIDNGDTRAVEYNEYTDILRKKIPETQIIIAAPVIAQSEEEILKNCSDRLIALHVEPYFFSVSQFYQKKS
ncbi:MAG: hypothetical protein ACOX6N_00910 [Patescibacteria group bacterium]|jgi:hypothetical protein